ncbi:N-acetylglutamate synthase [Corynespora cassiicola Philippines]|uniref:Amino-acid acetyltransferase, mitochondrial n=1 Tax=Corynespora cassiicola Philippines TaxID=1448308 RepID=A0A2T2NVD7_CORCC|nr:N-acetylglutamate synthase [Corynespora cassiicola Philippines]
MFICQKAQLRGLGRSTRNVLPTQDSICKPHEIPHPSRFSTSPNHSYSGIEPPRNGKKSSAKERQRAERTQLTRLLKESPGKRDARNFLKHFDTPKKSQPVVAAPSTDRRSDVVERAHHNEWRLTRTGVNLGNLYEPYKAIQDTPVFAQQPLPNRPLHEKDAEPLHLALVKLRQPQALDDRTLGGIALTLSQMAKLGLNIAVVVDCDDHAAPASQEPSSAWNELVREQSSRMVQALEDFNEPGAFEVDHALYYSYVDKDMPSTVQVRGDVEVKNNQLLFPPIEDGIIPVIPPYAYDAELRKVRVQADDVLLALTREFAGITSHNNEDRPEETLRERSIEKPLLDRIIILDPLGGIPSKNRADGAHVFINLEAEYQGVRNELLRETTPALKDDESTKYSTLGAGNPFSKFVEDEIAPLPSTETKQISAEATLNIRHARNLEVVHHALRLLPSSSSALIITPAEAAISSQATLLLPSTGVRTRRSKNPLIHNLLTDKPMISSSLPDPLVSRSARSDDTSVHVRPNPATFLKKGIPVTMIPDPRISGPWQPPSSPHYPSIELENDPRINFPRLVELIEDSFRRKLDARHYLERIRGRVAGVIIAGDYEGGAICTWETPGPASTSQNVNESGKENNKIWIPYLDKFAVKTASQGSGGVADIVWGALTRSCFPRGVVWRSRTSNPVNKWYFERAVGMWNLPGGYWTMFWTEEGVVEEYARKMGIGKVQDEGGEGEMEMARWDAYVEVCRGVVPSWADAKGTPD